MKVLMCDVGVECGTEHQASPKTHPQTTEISHTYLPQATKDSQGASSYEYLIICDQTIFKYYQTGHTIIL